MPIRPARLSDAADLARLRITTWRQAYRDLLPIGYLDSLSSASDELRWQARLQRDDQHVLVWDQGGQMEGFVVYGSSHSEDQRATATGEIVALYVSPDCWRTGIGAALLNRAISDLASTGLQQGVLWVLRDNTRARAFYEAMGLEPDGGAKTEMRGDGITLHQVRYRWTDRQVGDSADIAPAASDEPAPTVTK